MRLRRQAVSGASARAFSESGRTGVWLAGVLLITTMAYAPALQSGFFNLDDALYVTALRDVSWNSMQRVFATTFEGHYHPLTLISLGLNYRWVGGEAWSLHVVNLLIHLANTALVYCLARQLFASAEHAVAVALVFGVHPINSEAVCWITSRKDVQYAFFFLAALLAYLAYIRHGGPRYYAAAVLCHLLSLLSKGMAVSLAPALLVIDYAVGRCLRRRQVWLEKIPFFLLALTSGVVTYLAQQSTGYLVRGDLASLQALGTRIAYGCYGLVLYGFNFLLPVRLSAHYPYPIENGATPVVVWSALLVIPALVAAFVVLAPRVRLVAAALAFMLVNLGPMLKLVPVSDFIAADRYAYVASVGFALLVVASLREMTTRSLLRPHLARLLFLGYAGVLAVGAFGQSLVWQTSVGVWENALRRDPQNGFALNMLGVAWAELGEHETAISIYNRALRVDPRSARAYLNRGYALYRLNRHVEAEADFTQAIGLDADSDTAYSNRGLVRFAMGNLGGALADLNMAVQLNPDYPTAFGAYHHRGEVRAALGDLDGARRDFARAIALNPNFHSSQARLAAVSAALQERTPPDR